ncbi:MAG: methionine--tRNA ligase [Candidatus Thermoplasmatota archaeon]|nr:methionine--tRNA ligase [Candidatus Thermoplasmatota archaeon]
MKEKIFIGVAWPYANGSLHLGHIAGCYLPADIFARFNRMIGNDVLMVSGSDEHGTPVTITAEKEKITPQMVVNRYHDEHKKNMAQFGISFDLFTRTTTDNHKQVVQEIFTLMYKKDYIYIKQVDSLFCETCDRFLPDRYIEGKCPHCGNESARGDQCDECGKLLDPQDLQLVRCKICGNTPKIKTSEHFFLALSKFEPKLLDWIKAKKYWKASVFKFTENWLKNGLEDRAITRDMTWGIPVPLEEFENKRIYVWFDAVIGYLSASKEWAKKSGNNNKWEYWWKDVNSKHYYFLAKDNIPFHSLIWPSILMGYDEKLSLPYDIPANEYLRLRGEQFSKSRGIAVWIPDILEKFDVDAVRYFLSINMPENKDTNWTWEEFVTKNNDELVGTYGNFVHRVMTFTEKNFGMIPEPGVFNDFDKIVSKKINETSKEINDSLAYCHFKQGLKAAMALAQFGNQYFDQNQPWKLLSDDRKRCATVIYSCIKILKALSVFLSPFLPFSSEKLWQMLEKKEIRKEDSWALALENPKIGVLIEKPKPLFKKLELLDVMPERDPFEKIDLKVAKILEVKDIPKADKLYLLNIDLGEFGKRTIVAGIKLSYSMDELKGKNIVIVANLKPAEIRGIRSNGMLLAASDGGVVTLLDPGDEPPGSDVVIEGIKKDPAVVVEFDEFKKFHMVTGENGRIIYNGLIMKCNNKEVTTEKPVKIGANIS